MEIKNITENIARKCMLEDKLPRGASIPPRYCHFGSTNNRIVDGHIFYYYKFSDDKVIESREQEVTIPLEKMSSKKEEKKFFKLLETATDINSIKVKKIKDILLPKRIYFYNKMLFNYNQFELLNVFLKEYYHDNLRVYGSKNCSLNTIYLLGGERGIMPSSIDGERGMFIKDPYPRILKIVLGNEIGEKEELAEENSFNKSFGHYLRL